MKNLITFLLIIASLGQVDASVYKTNKYESAALGVWFAAGVATIPIALNWYEPQRNSKGLYISQQIDIERAVKGQFDTRSKLYYHYNRFEPSVVYEWYSEIGYESISAQVNYLIFNRKLGVLAGAEVSKIYRYRPYKPQQVNSVGLNIELRYLTDSRFSFSYTGNFKTRPEITKPFIFSGYFSVNFRLTK